MSRHLPLGRGLFPLALAVAMAGPAQPARATVVDIEFTASDFLGSVAPGVTGEPVPQNEVSGAFSVETEEVTPEGLFFVYDITPTASDLEIAGADYPPEGVQAIVGFRDGAVAGVQIGGTYQAPDDCCSGPVASIVTARTDDFYLGVTWDELGALVPPDNSRLTMFLYSTSNSVSFFYPYVMSVSVAIDGGIPQIVAVAETLPDASVCWDAIVNGTTVPDGGYAGDLLCAPHDSNFGGPERAAGTEGRLRDVKNARKGARGRAVTTRSVKTVLGTFTLAVSPVDRRLLAANAGDSAAVQAPADGSALACAKAKIARGTARLRPIKNAIVQGALHHVGAPTRLCVDESGAGGDLLCFRARSKHRRAKAEVWVAHALGTEDLTVGRTREVCIPSEPLD